MIVGSRWALRLPVLLVATLLALGAWQVYGAKVAQASETFPTNSWKCYEATPGGEGLDTDLTDLTTQFSTEDVTVRATKYLCSRACLGPGCTPTTTSPRLLKCYNITAAGPPAQDEITVVTPEFDDREDLTLRSAQLLCVEAFED